MQWQDQGIVLSSHPYGEQSVILTLLTLEHGPHGGLVRLTKSNKIHLQAGTYHQVQWRGRLPEYLGTWTLESLYSPLGEVLTDPLKLSALQSACALVKRAIPEREAQPSLFQEMLSFLKSFSGNWLEAYVRFEFSLLAAAGFTLDLSKCAVTESQEDLIYVSPRSGRAVSRLVGEPYKEQLLVMPSFIHQGMSLKYSGALEALDLISYFLKRYILSSQDLSMPAARERFYGHLKRAA